MYSQCPECQTRFRVTAEALRAAHGTVRCGRCGSAFDALARLSDTLPPARIPPARPPVVDVGAVLTPLPEGAPAAEYHFTADDLERVFIDAREWREQFGAEPANEEAPAPSGPDVEPAILVVAEDEPFEDITLEGERISVEAPPDFEVDLEHDLEHDLESTDEFEVLREVPHSAHAEDEDTGEIPVPELEPPAAMSGPEPEPEPEPEPAPATAPAAEPPAVATPAAGTLAAQRWRRADEPEPEITTVDVDHGSSGWRTLAWSVASLLCAIGLLAQVTHHYRQELVRHPQLGPVLREAYARLGLPLFPNWDLAAFELRQWGNASGSDASGRMSIRASLTNRAAFAQPHPILRLQLEDRFGESIAVRDFEPAEYLKNPAEATRQLAPGASTEADLEIIDPAQQAVGYRLDVCLRESAALLRCAQGDG